MQIKRLKILSIFNVSFLFYLKEFFCTVFTLEVTNIGTSARIVKRSEQLKNNRVKNFREFFRAVSFGRARARMRSTQNPCQRRKIEIRRRS